MYNNDLQSSGGINLVIQNTRFPKANRKHLLSINISLTLASSRRLSGFMSLKQKNMEQWKNKHKNYKMYFKVQKIIIQ